MSIIFEDVSKTFITSFRRKRIHAVVGLDLEITEGEIFGIIGPNGAGKSTILKMLMGFMKPDTGKINLMGYPPNIPKSRTRVGYMPENPYFYDHLTIVELMFFSATAAGVPFSQITQRSLELLKLVDLYEVQTQKLRSFSKGMMQRAGLCFALIHDPELIILDEPMSGLDPIGRKMVVDLILSLKANGKTILFCSHILSDVERLCDRIGIMSNGRLRKVLDKQTLLSSEERACIYVDQIPNKIKETLSDNRLLVQKEKDLISIDCPKKLLPSIISLCNKENIQIVKVGGSKNLLEEVFLETVHER